MDAVRVARVSVTGSSVLGNIGLRSLAAYMQAVQPLCHSLPSTAFPNPEEKPQWYGQVSFRYSDSTIFTTHFGHFFRAKVQLWSIAHDIAHELYKQGSNDVTLSGGQTAELYTQLQVWYSNLPDCLRPDRIVAPYQIQLQ
jgi:hypothetical protein